jgi:hypothetical protein
MLDKAKQLAAAGRLTEARSWLTEFVNGEDVSDAVTRSRALFLLSQLAGTPDEAIVWLQRALALNREQPKIATRLEQLASAVIAEVIKADGDDRPGGADRLLRLVSLPTLSVSLRVEALLWLSQWSADSSQAITHLRTALELHPGDARVVERLGVLTSQTSPTPLSSPPGDAFEAVVVAGGVTDEELSVGGPPAPVETPNSGAAIVEQPASPLRGKLSWTQPFRRESDVGASFVQHVDVLIEKAATLPPQIAVKAKRLDTAKSEHAKWAQLQTTSPGSQRTNVFLAPAVLAAADLADAFLLAKSYGDAFRTANMFAEMGKILVTRSKEKYQEVFVRCLMIASNAVAAAELDPTKWHGVDQMSEVDTIIRRIEDACLRRALSTYFQSASGEYKRANRPDEELHKRILNQAIAKFFDTRLQYLIQHAKPRVKDFIWANLPKVYPLELPDEWEAKRKNWKVQLSEAGFQDQIDLMEKMLLLVNPSEIGELEEGEKDEIKRAAVNNDFKRIAKVLERSANAIKTLLYRDAQEKLATFRVPGRPQFRSPKHNDWFGKIFGWSHSEDPSKLKEGLSLATELWREDIDNLQMREWVGYLNARTDNPHPAEQLFLEVRTRRTTAQQNLNIDWNLAVLANGKEDHRKAYELLLPLLDVTAGDADLMTVVLALSLRLDDRDRFLALLPRAVKSRYTALAFVVAFELGDREKQQDYLSQLQRRWLSDWEFPDVGSYLTTRELGQTVSRAIVERQVDPLILWLKDRIKRIPKFIPNYVELAMVLAKEKQDIPGAFKILTDRIAATTDPARVEEAFRDLLDLCKAAVRRSADGSERTKHTELGRRAFALAQAKRLDTQLLNTYMEFAPVASSPERAAVSESASEQAVVAPVTTSHPQPLPENLPWVNAQLSGVRTLAQYLRETKAIDEFSRILQQLTPHESSVVIEQIEQLAQVFDSFSKTLSQDRDSRRLLYDRANGIAQHLQRLSAQGAMSRQLTNLIVPYSQMVSQVIGDLSKQAEIVPVVEAVVENPFLSLDVDKVDLIVRVTNESDRPITDVAANLVIQTRLMSAAGNMERRIERLASHESRLISFPIRVHNARTDEARCATEAAFAVAIRASAEGVDNIDFMKPQKVRVVQTLAQAAGVDQIPRHFVIGTSLKRDMRRELFHGRDDIMRKIRGSFDREGQSERFFLDGIRRVGKTTILNFLPESLPERMIPVDVNLDTVDTRSPESGAILHAFCDCIWKALAAAGLALEKPEMEGFKASPATAFRDYLRLTREVAKGKTLLLMIDEFQELLKLVGRSGATRSHDTLALDQLRALMDEGELAAIFTGSIRFDRLADIFDHRILGSLLPLRVTFLPEDGVGRVLRTGMDKWVAIPDETVTAVWQQTGGYPWLVQIYGSSLVDLLNQEHRTIVTPLDVETVTRESVLPTDSFFRWWWAADQLGRAEEEFIERFLNQYSDRESVPMAEFFSSIAFREQSRFQRAFQNLRACEVLDSTQSDAVRIRGTVLRQWLRAHLFDGRLVVPTSEAEVVETRAETGIFIDHENMMSTLDEIGRARGLPRPSGRVDGAEWLARALDNIVNEVTRRVGKPEYRVAVAFWSRWIEAGLQGAYLRLNFDVREPENIKTENAVDFKLQDEVRLAERKADKQGARLGNVIVVAGDGDYSHLARSLVNDGVRVQMWAGTKAVNSVFRDLLGRENVIKLEDVCGL